METKATKEILSFIEKKTEYAMKYQLKCFPITFWYLFSRNWIEFPSKRENDSCSTNWAYKRNMLYPKSNKFRTLIFLKAGEDKFPCLWWQKVLPTHQKMREYCVFLTLSKNVLPFSAIYHEEHVILFPWGGYECYISTFNKCIFNRIYVIWFLLFLLYYMPLPIFIWKRICFLFVSKKHLIEKIYTKYYIHYLYRIGKI